MSTITVNISFQDSLLADIDKVVKLESRSRSELLGEAARERGHLFNEKITARSIKADMRAVSNGKIQFGK